VPVNAPSPLSNIVLLTSTAVLLSVSSPTTVMRPSPTPPLSHTAQATVSEDELDAEIVALQAALAHKRAEKSGEIWAFNFAHRQI
jgi:hypothetical protein